MTPVERLLAKLPDAMKTAKGWAARCPAHEDRRASLGHSTLVANKHYWQVTDADFTKAIGSNPKAAQKAAQRAHAECSGESHATKPAHKKAPVLLGSATFRDTLQNGEVGDTGLEPVTPSLSGTGLVDRIHASCGEIRGSDFARIAEIA
jgi:hypothetical protein